jgi:hypothetical protein
MKNVKVMVAFNVVVVLAALISWRIHNPPPAEYRITAREIERLHGFMTEAEITAILGRPPGDHRTIHQIQYDDIELSGEFMIRPVPAYVREWLTDDKMVKAGFNGDGNAVFISSYPALPPPPTWWERALERISRWFK